MKKFLAILLACGMVLSMSTAFATLGWAQSSTSSATATKGVSISVKALEFSGTTQDYTQYGLSDATVWKEITGRVVKDTLVKFPVSIEIPEADDTGLSSFDYQNAAIEIKLTNATPWKVVDANGIDIYYLSIDAEDDEISGDVSGIMDPENDVTLQFTILAIVDSTSTVNCSVNFTMGQKVYNDNTAMYFGNYVLYWMDGDHFTIMNANTGARIDFTLDADNKFTSSIWFYDQYLGESVPVHYCLNGELAFDGCCACNNYQYNSQIMSVAWYEQVKADFNSLMNALGFNFSYGYFTAAYCTKAGIASLLNAVNVTNSVTVGACTELSVSVTTPTVSIPQTGAVSLMGYALVALAGAALLASRKK